MIKWKKVGEEIPSKENRLYADEEYDPGMVLCLVWVCNPKIRKSGVVALVRWHIANKCWYMPDTLGNMYKEPNQITYFCDEINFPGYEDLQKRTE